MIELLSDEEWSALKPLVHRVPGSGIRPRPRLRAILDAAIYVYRTHCAWTDLPRIFPSAPTIKTHFTAWIEDGTLRRVMETLGESATGPGRGAPSATDNTVTPLRVKVTRNDFGPRGITIHYRVAGQRVRRRHDFGQLNQRLNPDDSVQQRLASILGVLGASALFKLGDIDRITARTARLSPATCRFLERTLTSGMAEFRLRNQLGYDYPVTVMSNGPEFSASDRPASGKTGDRPSTTALLMNGGGKDSVAAAEVLKEAGIPFNWLVYGTIRHHNARTMTASGVEEVVTVRTRGALPKKDVRYRGHLPFSALLAVIGTLVAHLSGQQYVVAANEYSANAETLKLDKQPINHQYTKSFEFERDFANILREEVGTDIHYFSLLRPLYETEIAHLIADHPQYFGAFISCNVGKKKDYWCKGCAKCAFVFLSLAPFLSEKELFRIFGENLIYRAAIREQLWRLTIDNQKPFDCVGTRDECIWALNQALERWPHLARLGVPGGGRLNELVDMSAVSLESLASRTHQLPAEIANPVMEIFNRYALNAAQRGSFPESGKVPDSTLSADELAQITGGRWFNLPASQLNWTGITLGTRAKPGNLAFIRNPRQWKRQPDDLTRIGTAQQRGAVAIVLDQAEPIPDNLPTLAVPDTRQALNQVAEACRERSPAQRILITGTMGKSGVLAMLRTTLKAQVSTIAPRSTSGTGLSILRELASLRPDHRFALFEASVNRNTRGRERGLIVRPQICVFTHLSSKHGAPALSHQRHLYNMAETVVGLDDQGVCVAPGGDPCFAQMKRYLQQVRPVPVLTFGHQPGHDARLINVARDSKQKYWQVTAEVMGRPVDYRLPVNIKHAPIHSVASLLLIEYLGLDLNQAVRSFGKLQKLSPVELAKRGFS